jgi:uncharacterized protein YndB with AHSA1/START domain/uncharacterized protein YciI
MTVGARKGDGMTKPGLQWVAAFVFVLAVAGPAWGSEMTEAGHQVAPTGRALEKMVLVQAPVEEVWRVWTTVEGVTSTFVSEAKIELRVGGPYEWYFLTDAPAGSRGGEGCKVLSFLPMRMLSFSWNAPPSIPKLREAGAKTHVVLEFEKLEGGRTRVKFAQLGFGSGAEWDEYYAYFDRAWGSVLENLAKKFASSAMGEAPAKKQFVYFVTPARDDFFDTGATPAEAKIIGEHFEYLKDLLADGTLILAGRSTGPPRYPSGKGMAALEMPAPGIVIFEAEDADSARKIMEGDPAVCEDVFKARVHAFGLALERGE